MGLGNKTTNPAAAKPTAPPTASAVSKYAGLATTQVTQRGNYLTPGHYLLRVNSFRKQVGFRAGPMFVGNLNVIHVFADSPATANPEGQEVSEVLKESNRAFMPRMRAFIDAAGALTQDDWTNDGGDAIVGEASGDSQPLAGKIVEARATLVVKETAQNKPQSELQPTDVYTRVDYLRNVTIEEAKETISAESFAKFFPDAV